MSSFHPTGLVLLDGSPLIRATVLPLLVVVVWVEVEEGDSGSLEEQVVRSVAEREALVPSSSSAMFCRGGELHDLILDRRRSRISS